MKPIGRNPHGRGRLESRGEAPGRPHGRAGRGRPQASDAAASPPPTRGPHGRGRRAADSLDLDTGPAHGHGHGHGRGWGGPGPGGGGGKRVLAPGDLRPLMLSLVAERPRYGYELMKAIEEMFSGAYSPSPGSVYPTLTLLEETGLLGGKDDDTGRRRYEVTRTGRTWLDENAELVTGVRRRVELAARVLAGRRPPEAIFQAMHTLKSALAMHSGEWTDAEVRRVAKLIDEAAARIHDAPSS